MNLEMNKDRILFRKVEVTGKTKGGIILSTHTAEADKRDTGFGEVIAVGDETQKFKAGDIIGFNDRMPMGVTFKGEQAFMIREPDVFFKVPDSELAEIEITAFQTQGNEFVDPQTKMLR